MKKADQWVGLLFGLWVTLWPVTSQVVNLTNRNYAFVEAFIDALVRLGLRHACITPGSRSTPLAVTIADHPQISDWSHHDERSSAFFALGIARSTTTPVAIVTTSGTAAAELYPAIIEARHSRVPLFALTADRPPALRGTGAPQTIDQVKLYGTAPKWFHETEVPGYVHDPVRAARALAMKAWTAMFDGVPGPVHINMPFDEPLVPRADDTPTATASDAELVYRRGRLNPDEKTLRAVAEQLSTRKTLVICGPQDDPSLAEGATALGSAAGWPIVADPLSQVRTGTHNHETVIATGDSLAAAGFLDSHQPEAILRFGALPTSKPLNQWVAAHREMPQIIVDAEGWRDAGGTATQAFRADAAVTATELAKAILGRAPNGWLTAWREADDAAADAIATAIEAEGFPTEPGIVASLARSLPGGATLWTASSMPVRDIDAYLPGLERSLRVLANRGANGIDGFLSSGLGSALVSDSPTYVLAGDLSTLYDLTALGAAARYQIPATIIVVNNDGGGIFHFLPQVGGKHFERHFGTPHGLDFVRAGDLFGIEAARVDEQAQLDAVLSEPPSGPQLIEVRTDRAENVAVHARIRSSVDKAIADS